MAPTNGLNTWLISKLTNSVDHDLMFINHSDNHAAGWINVDEPNKYITMTIGKLIYESGNLFTNNKSGKATIATQYRKLDSTPLKNEYAAAVLAESDW